MNLSLRARKALYALPIERLLPRWGELAGHESHTVLGDEADFNEYKAYALGDEVRRIDWKVYARRERYFIKRYSSERARSTLVLIDASASMKEAFTPPAPAEVEAKIAEKTFSTLNIFNWRRRKKSAPAPPSPPPPKNPPAAMHSGLISICTYLFYYLYLKQEPYGVAVIRKGDVHFHKVGSGSHQLQRMDKLLNNLAASGSNFYTTELVKALQYAPDVKNVIFLSDMHLDPHALIPFIKIINRRHLALTCLTYFNPQLLAIRFLNGLRWIKDRETGYATVMKQQDMRHYRRIVLAHYEKMERFLTARGIAYKQIDFRDQDELTSFIKLFQR